jgi:hypothetical protein
MQEARTDVRTPHVAARLITAALGRLRSQTSVELSCSSIESNAGGSDFPWLHGTSLKICKFGEQLLDLTLFIRARGDGDCHNAYSPKDARFVPAANVFSFVAVPRTTESAYV